MNGFNTLWKEVAAKYDKPLLMTEYGTGHPPVDKNGVMNEDRQSAVHESQWKDILDHAAGGPKSPNTAIGGVVFEWLDNWWQSGNAAHHDLAANGWHYEFCGIASQGDGKTVLFCGSCVKFMTSISVFGATVQRLSRLKLLFDNPWHAG